MKPASVDTEIAEIKEDDLDLDSDLDGIELGEASCELGEACESCQ